MIFKYTHLTAVLAVAVASLGTAYAQDVAAQAPQSIKIDKPEQSYTSAQTFATTVAIDEKQEKPKVTGTDFTFSGNPLFQYANNKQEITFAASNSITVSPALGTAKAPFISSEIKQDLKLGTINKGENSVSFNTKSVTITNPNTTALFTSTIQKATVLNIVGEKVTIQGALAKNAGTSIGGQVSMTKTAPTAPIVSMDAENELSVYYSGASEIKDASVKTGDVEPDHVLFSIGAKGHVVVAPIGTTVKVDENKFGAPAAGDSLTMNGGIKVKAGSNSDIYIELGNHGTWTGGVIADGANTGSGVQVMLGNHGTLNLAPYHTMDLKILPQRPEVLTNDPQKPVLSVGGTITSTNAKGAGSVDLNNVPGLTVIVKPNQEKDAVPVSYKNAVKPVVPAPEDADAKAKAEAATKIIIDGTAVADKSKDVQLINGDESVVEILKAQIKDKKLVSESKKGRFVWTIDPATLKAGIISAKLDGITLFRPEFADLVLGTQYDWDNSRALAQVFAQDDNTTLVTPMIKGSKGKLDGDVKTTSYFAGVQAQHRIGDIYFGFDVNAGKQDAKHDTIGSVKRKAINAGAFVAYMPEEGVYGKVSLGYNHGKDHLTTQDIDQKYNNNHFEGLATVGYKMNVMPKLTVSAGVDAGLVHFNAINTAVVSAKAKTVPTAGVSVAANYVVTDALSVEPQLSFHWVKLNRQYQLDSVDVVSASNTMLGRAAVAVNYKIAKNMNVQADVNFNKANHAKFNVGAGAKFMYQF